MTDLYIALFLYSLFIGLRFYYVLYYVPNQKFLEEEQIEASARRNHEDYQQWLKTQNIPPPPPPAPSRPGYTEVIR